MTDRGAVLVVDDSRESLQLLTEILSGDGYQVRPADSGELALASIAAKRPELILLDIRMPGMDGFEVCRRLETREESRNIPIVFISAAAEVEERVEGLRLGAVDFVSKPFHREELLARVRIHLELSRLRARLENRVAERTAELCTANEQLQRELTGRKRAEQELRESEERLTLTLKATNDGVWDWNIPSGDVVLSPRYYTMLGYDPYEFPQDHESWKGLVHPDDIGPAEKKIRDHIGQRDDSYAIEFRMRTKSGGWYWILSRGKVVERDTVGRPVRVVGAHTDITERKQAEEALREADRRKNEFLGVLSHELRNPLAPIRNSLYVLDHAPADSLEAASAKEIIQRQTAHLTRIVDDLLAVTRISRGKVELDRKRMDLRELVLHTCEDYRSVFERSQVELRHCLPASPVWIDADATRISQILGNLLHNAVKFTPATGAVAVEVEVRDGNAELKVTDTGAGMRPEEVERMFEPFAQAPQGLARTQGGLGLGLALAKGLVELQGGSIRARSEGPGRGSEFDVLLPMASTPAVAAAAPATAAPAAGGRLVLIIDDNVDTCESLSLALGLTGHQVRTAPDGRTGISTAHALKPEVVLCDIGLPDVDGYEVARALRADGALRSTRLIALSGYARPEDKERAREAGFEAHIAKPPELDELTEILARDACPETRGKASLSPPIHT